MSFSNVGFYGATNYLYTGICQLEKDTGLANQQVAKALSQPCDPQRDIRLWHNNYEELTSRTRNLELLLASEGIEEVFMRSMQEKIETVLGELSDLRNRITALLECEQAMHTQNHAHQVSISTIATPCEDFDIEMMEQNRGYAAASYCRNYNMAPTPRPESPIPPIEHLSLTQEEQEQEMNEAMENRPW